MHRIVFLAAILSMVATTTYAARCTDPTTHKFIKCPPATAPAASPASLGAPVMAGGHPQCKKGKVCGNSCIAVSKMCHK
jgi:hypothetical protein